jgi:Uma2 family endonuclease
MAIQPKPPEMSLAEFLAWESEQSTKYEYARGVVLAMAGASRAHGTIAVNLAAIVRPAVRGTQFRLYLAGMQVVAPRAPAVRYPDAVVTCDPRDLSDANATRHPRLIVEILSCSTASDDRGAKFAEYRTIPTLQEYVLVDSEQVAVDAYRRAAPGWTIDSYGPGDRIVFESIGVQVPIEALYEDLDLGPVERAVLDGSEDPS